MPACSSLARSSVSTAFRPVFAWDSLDTSRADSPKTTGELDAFTCGVSAIGVRGPGFIAGTVIRDLAALNKREMLAWDSWGLAQDLKTKVTSFPKGVPV